jgi:hypothetical protein
MEELKGKKKPAILTTDFPLSSSSYAINGVTAKEIREATFSIASEKAPTLDGLSTHFFKKVWPIIQFDVIEAIKGFFGKW